MEVRKCDGGRSPCSVGGYRKFEFPSLLMNEKRIMISRFCIPRFFADADDNVLFCFFEQVDVPYQYLTFFMEDDEELERIGEKITRHGQAPDVEWFAWCLWSVLV